MTVALINPNSTDAMTQSASRAARTATPDLNIEGWTSEYGPVSIEDPEDGASAIPPLLERVARASKEGAQAIILACLADTGLCGAKASAKSPVLSSGQLRFVLAAIRPGSAAVITTVEDAVPVIQQNIFKQDMASSVTQALAARVPVFTLDNNPEAAAKAFCPAAEGLDEEISTDILGCAGAVTISERIDAVLPQKILDGVTSAAHLARAVIA